MRRILVLGSKPDPSLPSDRTFDAVFCANASPFSAAQLDLPAPDLTVMTALLTDGSKAGQKRIEALSGLHTNRLLYYPRPDKSRSMFDRGWRAIKHWRMTPWMLKHALKQVDFTFQEFVYQPVEHYQDLIVRLCHNGEEIQAQLQSKAASSGLVAIALALAEPNVEEVIVSGFSFELTQAFGIDPNIDLRKTATSKHRDTDVTILSEFVRHHPIRTSELGVNQATKMPLIS